MEDKYRHIVSRHQSRIYSLALYMLGNKVEAEDVSQEVFERLWTNITKVNRDEALPWLLAVTKNRCIDLLRRRLNDADEDAVDRVLCQRADNTPEGFLANEHLSEWLKRAIATLENTQRNLIVQLDIKQLSVKEVAQFMNLSENQVKVYASRARKKLREYLSKFDF